MSAFKWLQFVFGVVIVAMLGAVLNEFVLPVIDISRSQSTTTASQAGINMYADIWTWIPGIALFLLVFILVVAIVVRRRAVTP